MPTATTAATTAITPTTAVSGGTASGTSITERGVVYSTTPNPRLGGAGVMRITSTSTSSTYSSNLTDLTPSTLYYVAAYATNVAGTGYGADQTFTTLPQPLLAYNFAANNEPSIRNPNVTWTVFARTGVGASTGAGRFNSMGWAPAANVDLAKYVSFTFAPNSDYQATLSSLSFVNQRSSTGPTAFEVRSSADGYAAALLTGTITSSPATVALSGSRFTNIQAVTSVTFRIYAYNASGPTGTYSVDDVQLYGTVTAAPDLAPEPTVQPTVTPSSITNNSVLLTVAGGNGAKRLVVLRPAAASAVAPTDRLAYSASLTYGTTGVNSTTGTSNFVVVADGSTTAITETGLQSNTAYTAEAYAYNDGATTGIENYLTATPGTATFTTLPPPVATYVWNGLGTSYTDPL
ncbi:MAG TPA: hypothetical protein VF690_14065, partial [Hymenobacter sp.]